jgi:repressor LexA
LQRGLTLEEIGKRIGVAKSTIQRYEKGDIERLKLPVIESIANALNVAPNWLIGNADTTPAPIPPGFLPLPKSVRKPLVGSIACGEPITAEENIEGYVEVPEGCSCDFCLRCVGDSMIDAHIVDGDIVYIRTNAPVINGQIYAVRIEDEATLKRVYYNEANSTLTLIPANTAYTPHTYTGAELDSIHIEGMAVGFTHWYR